MLTLYLSIMTFAPSAFEVNAQTEPPADCPPMYPVQCHAPQTKPEGKRQAWPQGAHITVNIDPSYNDEQRRAIEKAFQNWQAASGTGGNGSGVTFTFTYNTTPPSMNPPAGTYNIQVWNRNSPHAPGAGGDNAVADNGTNAIS